MSNPPKAKSIVFPALLLGSISLISYNASASVFEDMMPKPVTVVKQQQAAAPNNLNDVTVQDSTPLNSAPTGNVGDSALPPSPSAIKDLLLDSPVVSQETNEATGVSETVKELSNGTVVVNQTEAIVKQTLTQIDPSSQQTLKAPQPEASPTIAQEVQADIQKAAQDFSEQVERLQTARTENALEVADLKEKNATSYVQFAQLVEAHKQNVTASYEKEMASIKEEYDNQAKDLDATYHQRMIDRHQFYTKRNQTIPDEGLLAEAWKEKGTIEATLEDLLKSQELLNKEFAKVTEQAIAQGVKIGENNTLSIIQDAAKNALGQAGEDLKSLDESVDKVSSKSVNTDL